MEYDVTASALATSGIRIEADYGGTGGNNVRSLSSGILGRTLLKLGRTGVSDILTISAVRTTNSDSTVYASIEWREIR